MMLLPCTCTHPYQEKLYGKLRVHTETKQHKRPEERLWRCTVCLKEKDR